MEVLHWIAVAYMLVDIARQLYKATGTINSLI